MKITRKWAMPNKNTFDVKPIKEFISPHLKGVIIDPFANSNKLGTITNDLDPAYDTDYNLDALDFLKLLPDNFADVMLFDPPYSPRQVSESYKKLGLSVNMQTTQSSFWSKLKDEITRVCADDGVVLSFGWNSQGMGINRGFSKEEILLVAHGGSHNDTICLCEVKDPQ